MCCDESGREIGAFLGWSTQQSSALNQIVPIGHTSHAMVLSIATATRGKARRLSRAQREERRDNWEAKHGQQQDGKKSTQLVYEPVEV
jgi:hypothetical protein